jgi:hypothetical protein|tara:strand:- start:318 stop:566 length:249 start_codon:yes stop_codon:yes gene_type:complete
MALTAANLKLVAGGGTGNVFHYNTADAPATVAGSGYFNSVTANLKQYDIILVAGTTGGTVTIDMLVVTSASGAATVTTTNGT